MIAPHRGEKQATPVEHGIIHFPFCQQSCFERAVSKVSVTLSGQMDTLPKASPSQQATQRAMQSQQAKKRRSVETPVACKSLLAQRFQAR